MVCTGERENRFSKPFVLAILHWERTNKLFGKRFGRLLKVFIAARSSSKSAAAANRRLEHWWLHSIRRTVFVPSARFIFLTAPAQYVLNYIIQFLIMFSKIVIMLCLITSMIELLMLVCS